MDSDYDRSKKMKEEFNVHTDLNRMITEARMREMRKYAEHHARSLKNRKYKRILMINK